MLWKCSPIVTRLKNKKDINVQKYKIIYKKITKVKKFKIIQQESKTILKNKDR